MSILQSILLGALQGLAEFLPISSSGHLAIAQKLFGLEDLPLLFDVFLHLATLCAVVLFFWKKIWKLLCTFARLVFRRPAPEGISEAEEKNSRSYILAVILTTLVTGVIGIAVEKLLPSLSIKFVCAGFIVTAFLLILSALVAKRQKQNADGSEKKAPSKVQALIIGLAQGFGTLPGISRSGSTIAGALSCGVNRQVAGEYSFIASIPAILGAFILEAKDLGEVSSSIGILPVVAGCVTAFAVGYLSLALLMKIIKKGKLEWFACYLIPAGILGLLFL
ncbi:MAG: undecaprenyl-diphosphate phosphatase [Treponema sp.]|nr:undecaprenyl-diphosphate phosphatase [Treponema sp.]